MPDGNPIVIKLGGALIDEMPARAAFWQAVDQLRRRAPVVLVHGAGPQATAMARRLGHTPRIIQGRRVTTDLDLQIIHWTLRGAANARLAAQAQQYGLPAVGICGADGGLVRVVRRPPWEIEGERVDFGWVGDVQEVETGVLDALLGGGFLPVVASMGIDTQGQTYNVNADTVALAVAAALEASELLLVTEAGGLKRGLEAAERLPVCDAALYADGTRDGWIQGGMRVKLQVAFGALEEGIETVFVLAPDDLLDRAYATRVVP